MELLLVVCVVCDQLGVVDDVGADLVVDNAATDVAVDDNVEADVVVDDAVTDVGVDIFSVVLTQKVACYCSDHAVVGG